MTNLIEDALLEPELASPAMVKCSWCVKTAPRSYRRSTPG